MLKALTCTICMTMLWAVALGQYILNGDFETNDADPGVNQMNMNDAQFNAMVEDCFSFGGTFPSGNLDLITTGVWGGLARSGDWFIGIGYRDRLSMRLSGPLVIGQSYQLSFYDRAWPGHCVGPVSIGLAMGPSATGYPLYTAPQSPVVGVWKLRVVTFSAPVAANYITVRLYDHVGCWQHVDNFCLSVNMDCVIATMINVPNVFTPNSDGMNDRFLPFEGAAIIGGTMDIYNRWGQHLFSTKDLDKGWDGTSEEGRHSPDGVYFYRMTYSTSFGETGSTNGSVTLTR